MKRVIVLCSGYPTHNNPYNCTWAHTRNRYYILNGIDVHVHQTDSDEEYELDGVKVIGRKELEKNIKSRCYDLAISHSPNIRKHIPLLRKMKSMNVMLFMHGSESMAIERDYPKPYPYMASPVLKKIARNIYDEVKFKLLANFIRKNKDRVMLIFVSDWMRAMFESNVLSPDQENVKYEVIHNSLNEAFVVGTFKQNSPKIGDFVTLRRLDYSKFAIDMVVALAKANPDYTFDIYGRGRFFEFYEKPENVKWHDKHIRQDDIPELLNGYRCALMPTRCDAQGVMACEMATYGMPVITTDIAVNREMFLDFDNVKLLAYEEFAREINMDECCLPSLAKNHKFSHENTLFRELSIIKSL
jgi:glycosyltransferase involved in cell wall biosynthesis